MGIASDMKMPRLNKVARAKSFARYIAERSQEFLDERHPSGETLSVFEAFIQDAKSLLKDLE